MPIKSILVATELSVRDQPAVERALQLAMLHRAALQLMYLPAAGKTAAPDAAARLAAAARQVEYALGRPVRKVLAKAHTLRDLKTEARSADLLVLSHGHERTTAAFFRGHPVIEIVRECRCPVLVARSRRRPRSGRVLVAIDFSRGSRALAMFAARLDPQAQLQLFHVIDRRDDARLPSAPAAERTAPSFRRHRMADARERLVELAGMLGAGHPPQVAVIGHGDAGHQLVLQQEHTAADCVVVGKREASAWSDFFRGSVAHCVLSWAGSDVLVVPDGWASLSRRPSRALAFGERLNAWPQVFAPRDGSAA